MDEALRRQRVLRQHLKTDTLLGVAAVPRSDVVHAVAPPTPATPATPRRDRPQPAPVSAIPSTPAAPAPAKAPAVAVAAGPPLDRAAKLRVLQAIDENEVRGCTKCELCHGRTQTIFGEGDPDADILFIGEGPGRDEDEQGRPFVGRSGQLLTKMIEAMGLSREQVFITNVVKCRPPNNRTPTPAEVATCWDYLRRQIEAIRPKAIVTLGGPAAKAVLETKEGITRLRGTWHRYESVQPAVPVMPTFHPAYVLRQYTKENRARVWSDLQAVLKQVGRATE
ncbi:MAG: uracil-DNA glycosylase [Phycisphaeraceae bacterium]